MAEANTPPTVEPESTTDMAEQQNAKTEGVDQGMEKFLQKTRSELMYELRRIQHGERPVTGTDYRDSINQFFAKHLETPTGAEGKENIPANVDSVEEHRPESVVVEVQGLFEQQRVSSVLQSTAFRRSLENIIRGSIGRATGSNSTRITPSRRETPSRRDTPNRTVTPEVRSRAQSEENVISASSPNVSTSSSESPPRVPSPVQASPAAEAAEVHHGAVLHPVELPSWQTITQVHRDEIIDEISELLHSRLVSSTLDGEFRGTLEIQMQNHVAQGTNNGEAVAEFVRSLPANEHHLRNDFSHLGLIQPQDNFDNISVTSVSATAVPYTQSNLHLSREIQSLKSQMLEMKNMIKLSFDLQMDIQRAIRQEVAAAIASGLEGASAVPLPQRTQPVDDTLCLICLDKSADSVLYQCGHLCMCYPCGKHLLSRGGKCPVCRAPIKDIIRAYKSNEN